MQFPRISLVFLILFVVLFNQNAHSYERASILVPTSKKIRIGVFNAPPVIIIDDESKPKGMVIDFLNEIARRESWEIEWVKDDWSNLLKKAQNNQLDLISFIAHSDERAQYLQYSKENFMTGWGQVYTHDKSKFQSVIDFDGKTVAILDNEIHGINFKKQCSG